MIKETKKAKFAFAISLFLIANLLTGIEIARAATPTLSSTSNISNGVVDPNIVVKSTNFATDANKFVFTVDVGTTGLNFDSVAFISSASVRLNFRGTALAGSISIQANTSAFKPVADSLSSTLIINVPDPLIVQIITFDDLLPIKVNDSSQILSASSTSGLEVSFSSKTPNTCRIVSQKINAIAAGECSIKASQNGNTSYSAALDIIKSITISPVVSVMAEKPASGVSNGTTLATVEYSPTGANNSYKDLVLSSSGNGQLGTTKLRLFVPSGATKSRAAFLVSSFSSDSENEQGFFVARIGLVNEFGAALNHLDKVYKINMPRGYLYSEIFWSDLGIMWQRIPETIKESLPTDSHAAFFREANGSVTVLTDQLGLFGYRFPQIGLEVSSPTTNMMVGSQIQLSNEGGSGTGEVIFGTTTSQVCTVTPAGVLTGTQAGACFITARKNASEHYIDTLSNKIIVTVQGAAPVRSKSQGATPVTSKSQGAAPVAVNKGSASVGQTTCNSLSYSLTLLSNQAQAKFCPKDAGNVAILYVRSASSTRKWVDKELARSVIDANGNAVFDSTLEILTSDYLHVFVNGQPRLKRI